MIVPLPLRVEGRGPHAARLVLALVVLNVLVFIGTGHRVNAVADRIASQVTRIADWELTKATRRDPGVARLREQAPDTVAFLQDETLWRNQTGDPELEGRLSGLLDEYRQAIAAHPLHQHGLVPSRLSVARLFSHMFLHVDVLHLLFNMYFLWVVGGALESALGPLFFGAIYFGSGLVAALAHLVTHPGSAEPAVGASGAVAGLMGAFTLGYARTRVRIAFIYILAMLPRVRFLDVPAAILFGCWLVEQVFYSLFGDLLQVAFAAHIGGFLFGAGAILLIRRMGRSSPSRPATA